ncbi:hypothetical protein [Streptomyces erythrochromogenes]|uniref:hypothetical protein n=1 Tax=Streptomyces erythrochromogenes TaxID=285574 RepID=UPI003F4D8DAE
MTLQRRILIFAVALAVLTAVGLLAVLRASSAAEKKERTRAGGPRTAAGAVSLAPDDGGRRIVFRNMAWGPHRDEPAHKDGGPYRSADVNFRGVTFADDERTFYATMAAGGRTHLVRGDLAERTVTTLRENVECPSL